MYLFILVIIFLLTSETKVRLFILFFWGKFRIICLLYYVRKVSRNLFIYLLLFLSETKPKKFFFLCNFFVDPVELNWSDLFI